MECEFPRVNSSEIAKILKSSKTIAIVGLSPKSEKDSNIVAKYLQKNGYRVIPIYPKESEILGERVYRSLLDIPKEIEIDIVDIFRKPEVIQAIVDEAKERGGVKTIWSQLGIVNNEAMERAKELGFEVVQNHCIKIEHMGL